MAKHIHSRDVRKKWVVQLMKKKSGATKITRVEFYKDSCEGPFFIGTGMIRDLESKKFKKLPRSVIIYLNELFNEFGMHWTQAVEDNEIGKIEP